MTCANRDLIWQAVADGRWDSDPDGPSSASCGLSAAWAKLPESGHATWQALTDLDLGQ